MEADLLLWGVLFSGIGIGFFLYGKKQKKLVPLFCGIGLMVLPYFLSSVTALTVISIVLMAIPYFVRR